MRKVVTENEQKNQNPSFLTSFSCCWQLMEAECRQIKPVKNKWQRGPGASDIKTIKKSCVSADEPAKEEGPDKKNKKKQKTKAGTEPVNCSIKTVKLAIKPRGIYNQERRYNKTEL